jgi:membrane associated rhomboid family serine protease
VTKGYGEDPTQVRTPDRGKLDWRASWTNYVPSSVLAAVMILAFISRLESGSMASWGVSAAVLAQGKYENILLHMLAHGAVVHLLMNTVGLLEIGGLVVARLGGLSRGWFKFLIGFSLSGLAAVIFYLSFHPTGTVPMIGASGAIYGLLGLLLSSRLNDELDVAGIRMVPHALWYFVRNNLIFLLLLVIVALLTGFSGGVAWEAHLGGFMFGFCFGPWLFPKPAPAPLSDPSLDL